MYASRPRSDPRYSWLSPGYAYMIQERQAAALRMLRRFAPGPLETLTVLDLGCGTGQWIRDLVEWGVQPEAITGLDLLEHRLEEARRRCAPGVHLRRASAAQPEVPDASFDVIIQSTMFSSVLDESIRAIIAGRMLRALQPQGIILWYDFFVGSPRNPNVRAVTRREIARLFHRCRIDLERLTLAPPLARRIAPLSPTLCQLLGRTRVLCTHYLGVIRKA